MKTESEILEYLKQTDDPLGFKLGALGLFVSRAGIEADYPDIDLPPDYKPIPLWHEEVIAVMRDYMDFAWTKVRGHRGISAGRSVQKYEAWAWLLDDEETVKVCRDNSQYAPYGAPILKHICGKYGFEVPRGEDVKRMVAGQPCEPGCEGCTS